MSVNAFQFSKAPLTRRALQGNDCLPVVAETPFATGHAAL